MQMCANCVARDKLENTNCEKVHESTAKKGDWFEPYERSFEHLSLSSHSDPWHVFRVLASV